MSDMFVCASMSWWRPSTKDRFTHKYICCRNSQFIGEEPTRKCEEALSSCSQQFAAIQFGMPFQLPITNNKSFHSLNSDQALLPYVPNIPCMTSNTNQHQKLCLWYRPDRHHHCMYLISKKHIQSCRASPAKATSVRNAPVLSKPFVLVAILLSCTSLRLLLLLRML